MKPLIKPLELIQLLDTEKIVLVDARSGADAGERFAAGHLPGAVQVDLDKDLSQKKSNAADGGRHPLPDPDFFARVLGNLGIEKNSQVVVYDDKGGANAAARFWWMLRAAGHEKIQVLDGGMNAAVKQGLALSTAITVPANVSAYPFSNWQSPLADIDEVAAGVTDPEKLVIDVREAYRYKGESEPIDTVAGHIPGAVNIPYTGNLDSEGNFLPADELAKKYGTALQGLEPGNIIVHCGSGVTACHTLLALEQAGIRGAGLYVGSWSEWSRNERPLATGE